MVLFSFCLRVVVGRDQDLKNVDLTSCYVMCASGLGTVRQTVKRMPGRPTAAEESFRRGKHPIEPPHVEDFTRSVQAMQKFSA